MTTKTDLINSTTDALLEYGFRTGASERAQFYNTSADAQATFQKLTVLALDRVKEAFKAFEPTPEAYQRLVTSTIVYGAATRTRENASMRLFEGHEVVTSEQMTEIGKLRDNQHRALMLVVECLDQI